LESRPRHQFKPFPDRSLNGGFCRNQPFRRSAF
jgi:hypothetical protein